MSPTSTLNAVLSLAAVVVTTAALSTAAQAGPFHDALVLGQAKAQLNRDRFDLTLNRFQKQQDINNFARDVSRRRLGSALGDLADIRRDDSAIRSTRGRVLFDRFEVGAARAKLNSDF